MPLVVTFVMAISTRPVIDKHELHGSVPQRMDN